MLNTFFYYYNLYKPKFTYGDTTFITGLRGFAILGVVLIHTGGAGLRDLGIIGHNIVDLGSTGVYVFFVISGFAVTHSYKISKGYWSYISKRLWRLVPLYYFWLFVYVLFWSKSNNPCLYDGLNFIYNIFLHIFFIGYLDYRMANPILNVEWSLFVEFFWYFMIPFLIYFINNSKVRILFLIVISLFILISLREYVFNSFNKEDQKKYALLIFKFNPIVHMF